MRRSPSALIRPLVLAASTVAVAVPAAAGTAAATTPIDSAGELAPGLAGTPVAVQPAIVVKVDNVDAEPQTGLNHADIVFEEIVEGRATRFAAVFHSTDPDPVGPVRSARYQDIDLLASLNDPALVYSGANENVNAALQDAGIEHFGESAAGFFRRDDLPAPHNLFVNLSEIRPQVADSGDAAPIFEYAEPDVAPAGTPVTYAEMMVGGYDVRWDWDDAAGVFLRSQLGSEHELTGGQASTDNVLVLELPYGRDPNGGPEAVSIGGGQAVLYTQGQRIEGTWSRESATDPFTLETGDGPILLTPGRTWVELVDEDHALADG